MSNNGEVLQNCKKKLWQQENLTGSFRFSERIRRFEFAFAGIWTLLKTQQNSWIHAVATICVCSAGFFFGISSSEWCWIVLAIMSVWTTEALNTAFEFLADVVSPEFHPMVKQSKDVAAGAVLLSAIGSVIIGVLVLGSYAVELVK